MEKIIKIKVALPLYSKLKLFIGLQLLLCLVSFLSQAQENEPMVHYVCPDATESIFLDNLKVGRGDWVCSSGTDMKAIVSNPSLGQVTVIRMDDGPHRAQVNVTWNPGQYGVMVVRVEYRRHLSYWTGKCHATAWEHMYTYEIHKEKASPGGSFGGNMEAVVAGESVSKFNLTYEPSATEFRSEQECDIFPGKTPVTNCGLLALRMRYWIGNAFLKTEKEILRSNLPLTYMPTPFQVEVTGKGSFILNTEVYVEVSGQCGTWLPIQPQLLTVRSSCFKDDFSDVSITPMGSGVKASYLDEVPPAFNVEKGKTYTLDIKNITDFSSHYALDFSDFGLNKIIQGADNSFTIAPDINNGSYRIIIKLNGGDAACPTPRDIPLLIGDDAHNTKMVQKCTITLPDDIATWYRELTPKDVVLRHFAAYVETERSIILKPGITLELGAELFLDYPEPVPDEKDADLAYNFIHQTTYDEYGRTLGESRSYFDKRGVPLQSQAKAISKNVILASATLYDAYGRPAISTLPAPVAASKVVPAECPDDAQVGSKLRFAYKPDFISANETEPYTSKHFDIVNATQTNETTPLAVYPKEGTLGWYYSASNTDEPAVATTSYPYSRTLYKHDGTGDIKGVTRPGDEFKAGSLYLATANHEPVLADDPYFNTTDYKSYFSIRKNELGLSLPSSIVGEFFKTVSTNEVGNKSITYTDKSGKTIIALYLADQVLPITTSYQFYDNAGRLLVSISPNGLEQYSKTVVNGESVTNFASIDKTSYAYNSRGLLKAVYEKIAGQNEGGISRTEYMYRKDGMIRFSQNEEQRKALPAQYAYTNYDNAGRPVESGVYTAVGTGIAFGSQEMKSILENKAPDGGLTGGLKTETTFTRYDEPDPAIPVNETQATARVQRFVYGAVSRTKNDNVTSWYSYDERGRVEWMVQRINGFRPKIETETGNETEDKTKTLDYRYGPTGQVEEVTYQKNESDQFVHFYEYDADGRLSKVYTGRELLVYNKLGKLTNAGITYSDTDDDQIVGTGPLELQATYSYYLHGPLKRVELANKLQGIDYTYTVDGALKSINNADPDKEKDPGKDGVSNGFKQDVFGMSIDYYANDYAPANGATDGVTGMNAVDQHTGLIKATRWHSPIEKEKQVAYAYQYDKRNQFTKAEWGTVNGTVFTSNPLEPYHEGVGSYDANGNINTLTRNAAANFLNSDNIAISIADFKYHYKPNTNMLERITKGTSTTELRSYKYNDLGQTIEETIGETTGAKSKFIKYDVSGKVTGVYTQADYTKPITTFLYDDRGFRVSKTTYDDAFKPVLCTWYVRDASGNVVTTYEDTFSPGDIVRPQPVEVPVYGSGKIGLYLPESGNTNYELTDHLGNVRAVIGKPFNAEYVATMETERNAREIDDGFLRLAPAEGPLYANHTTASIEVDGLTETITQPNEVLRMSNVTTGGEPANPVGTGIMLFVQPGDVVNAEVFAKYTNFNKNNSNILGGLSGFLTTMFGPGVRIDGGSAFNVVNSSDFSNLSVWGKLDETQPRAFLNYLLFDNDFNLQKDGFDFDQVSSAAEVSATTPGNPHERLALGDNLKIEKEGYLYIYVSNESDQNMEVYFDDLRVKHAHANIVAGGDYYPYGLEIKDRQIARDKYRHRYQGQYAEKDEETGFLHFELREYDATIGRWLSPDPKRLGFSPYIGMGNDPVNMVDPDGGGPWKPDENGNLVAEAGDNVFTLADFLNVSVEDATAIFTNYANWDGGRLTNGLVDVTGHTLTLDNVYTRSITFASANPGEFLDDAAMSTLTSADYFRRMRTAQTTNYNCWGSAYSGSQGRSIIPGVGIGDGAVFDGLLTSSYNQVAPSNSVFGKTAIRFQSGGAVQHGAVFYGRDKSGSAYVYTKNGWVAKPKVMRLDDLMTTISSYGAPGGIGGGSGYYNPR